MKHHDVMEMEKARRARRAWLIAAVAAPLAMNLRTAFAAPPLVEIFAYAHPPVQAALKSFREWLAHQGSAIRVLEI
jgi:hypothetical protein